MVCRLIRNATNLTSSILKEVLAYKACFPVDSVLCEKSGEELYPGRRERVLDEFEGRARLIALGGHLVDDAGQELSDGILEEA